ncbi:uncharacterized protein [Rutidosis leptorrhynchoides]|uniref:uncharacterized protein n=1 Tax=Rutidosis leptorrhynchoides TaxID=125765 RepID=UPI003A9A2C87
MAKSRKPLIICCAVTLGLVLIISITSITLYFTLFKPKQPKITTQSVTLDSFSSDVFDITNTNVTLGVTITVNNPNYGGFKYENSTSYVTYHGDFVAEAPVMEDTIPARGVHDVSTTVLVVGKSLLTNPSFLGDLGSNTLNFTAITGLKGKAIVFKYFKKKATTMTTCDISVHIIGKNSTSVAYKLKNVVNLVVKYGW